MDLNNCLFSQTSPGIKLSSKRPVPTNKCIKCQTVKKNEKLHNGIESSFNKFVECYKLKNDDISPNLKNNTLLVKGCHQRYTAAATSTKSTGGDKSIQAEYDSAFLKPIDEIEQKLVKEWRAWQRCQVSTNVTLLIL